MGNDENRFGYLRSKTEEELEAIIKETEEDIETCYNMLDDGTVPYQEKTELRNDLLYDRDILDYIKKIREEKTKITK